MISDDASRFLPADRSIAALRMAAVGCTACPLFERGTQTVFGEGANDAAVMLVGEQPGDQEDLSGHPFVGPAGRLLDRALQAAGVDRSRAYVTNAVKHFKWEPRGKRRLHAKPNSREIAACHPWLVAEIDALHPILVVALGATAAQALLGRSFKVTEQRGQVLTGKTGQRVMATVHPSSLLRQTDPSRRDADFARFVDDLRQITKQLEQP